MARQKIFNNLLKQIDMGKDGLNVGLSNGFNRLNEFLHGVQRKTYYTIGGETGSGKSSLALHSFVYSPYVNLIDKSKLRILYLSFELPKEELLGKLTARHLYETAGVTTDINELLSRGKHRISDELYLKVVQTKDFFEEMEDHFFIIDNPLSPKQIEDIILKFTSQFGSFNKVVEETNDGLKIESLVYTPNVADSYLIVILDHAGKIPGGSAKKQVIDEVSDLFVQYRNLTGISPVMVNQLNRDNSDVQRMRLGQVDPKLSDWKDTNCVPEDCNVALAVFNPKRHNIPMHKNYDIEKLKDRYRSVSILKNRYGPDSKYLGCAYFGEVGKFVELPNSELTMDQYEYFNNPNSYLEALKRFRAK